MKKLPHVALLIETSRSYGRALLRGIRRFITEHEPWSVYLESRSLESDAPPWLKNWKGDGILTRTGSQAMANAIRQTGLPTVELRSTRFKHDFPFVGVDNTALVKSVLNHFQERGFSNFGVFALESESYFALRCKEFAEAVAVLGHECHIFRAIGNREKPSEWETQQQQLACWLERLPKPVGVLACTDQLGFWILDACKRSEIAVPEEIAVVGVENDESLCTMATPPLSSMALGGEQVGFAAAQLLDRMMRGKCQLPGPTLLPPPGVVVRQSSDVVAIEDAQLAAAVRFIREHAIEGIGVDDVLKVVPISRSSLERRMRQLLGRSPNMEINRMRLQHVRKLLAETDLNLEIIAQKSGFQYQQYLAELFRRTFGETPGQWRRRFRRS